MEGGRRARHRVSNRDQDNSGPARGPGGKAAGDPSVRAARVCGRAGRRGGPRFFFLGSWKSKRGAGREGREEKCLNRSSPPAFPASPAFPAERARTYSTIIGKIDTKTIPMVTREKFSFTTA